MYIKIMFTIAFPGNPGKLRQPQISIYGDGNRPTLYSPEDFTAGMICTSHIMILHILLSCIVSYYNSPSSFSMHYLNVLSPRFVNVQA